MIHGVSPSFGAGRPGSQCNAPLSCSPPPSAVPMPEPEADAGDEAGGMDVLASKPRQTRRGAGFAQIREADIGCELAAEHIGQARAELYLDQPRTAVVLRTFLQFGRAPCREGGGQSVWRLRVHEALKRI